MNYYQELVKNAEETYELENKTHYVGSLELNELDPSFYLELKREGYIDEESAGIVYYDFFEY